MRIKECIWRDKFVDKIIRKHNVYPKEVEEVFRNNPIVQQVENGCVRGEDLYIAFGQSDSGRYLNILFIRKKDKHGLIISARDMTKRERKRYGKKK